MQKGLSRFEYFLNQLQTLLTAANKQKNPALWLYKNNARTPLFMLEGLSKLYAELHNKKKFTKIKAHFKLLEDALGAIDYYDSIARDLVANKKVPASVITYLQAEAREKIQNLNEILAEQGWLLPDNNRPVKIHGKLLEANWMEEKEEINAISQYYGETIYDINEFIREKEFHFNNMEADVHELRRKLRWLSIYPQGLMGCIQLEKGKNVARHLKKYSTAEIVASPFNLMPPPGNCRYILALDQQYYYSLSWLIAELGRIKDNGLHIIAIKEAMQLVEGAEEAEALKKTMRFLGVKQPPLPKLLEEATQVARVFFNEQNLEHLVIGPRKTAFQSLV